MGIRAERKAASRERILKAAARLIREAGTDGAGVAEVMAAAGLTHGAFYSHFKDKDAMLAAALEVATGHRERWLNGGGGQTEAAWVERIARRYLTEAHRENPGDGCPYPPLAAEVARGSPPLKAAFAGELLKTVARMEAQLEDDGVVSARDKGFALLSLMAGALALARASDEATAAEILGGARRYATAAARHRT